MLALPPSSCWAAPGSWPPAVFGWLLQIGFDGIGAPGLTWTSCLKRALMRATRSTP
jgi:hypothetical protein